MKPAPRLSALVWLLAACLLATVPASFAQKKPGKPAPPRFLTKRYMTLYIGDLPFRNVGANVPELFERFLSGQDAAAVLPLEGAKEAGVAVVRCWGTTWGHENFGLFFSDRDRWLRAFDRTLAECDLRKMSVVPSLLANPRMLSAYVRATTESKDEDFADTLTPGSRSNQLAVEYVTAVVTRYRNDPRVLMWEVGGKYNLEADLPRRATPGQPVAPRNAYATSDQMRAFLAQIAGVIKKSDRNHFVTSGCADMRPYSWHLRQSRLNAAASADPLDFSPNETKDSFRQYVEMMRFFHPDPVDVISVHLYALQDKETPSWLEPVAGQAFTLSWARTASDLVEKPLFVGEFASPAFAEGKEQPAGWSGDFLRRMRRAAAPVACVWAWEDKPQSPERLPFALSPQRTPSLVRQLADVNAALLRQSLAVLNPDATTEERRGRLPEERAGPGTTGGERPPPP